jgi:hypothetical protein
MPLNPRPLFILAAFAAGSLAVPAGAQTVDVPGNDGARVPYMPGNGQTETLGPPQRGAVGRPRRFGQLQIQLDVQPTCTLHAGFDKDESVRCSHRVPFLSVISSDTDTNFTATQSFAQEPDDHGLVLIHAQRLTVDY